MLGEFFFVFVHALCAGFISLITFLALMCSVKTFCCYSRAPCAGFSSRLSIFSSVGYQGDMKVSTVGVKFPRTFVLGEVFFVFVQVRCAGFISLITLLILLCSVKTFYCYSRALCAGFSFRLNTLPFVVYQRDMKGATVGVQFPRAFVLGEVFFLFFQVRCAQCIW